MWPGQANSLEIQEKLYDQQSEFQHVQVFKTSTYGNLLVLDGCIQATERDEFAYQEMIARLEQREADYLAREQAYTDCALAYLAERRAKKDKRAKERPRR